MAGVALWLVGAVVAVVVLVGLVIFLVMLRSANLDLLQFVYLLPVLEAISCPRILEAGFGRR